MRLQDIMSSGEWFALKFKTPLGLQASGFREHNINSPPDHYWSGPRDIKLYQSYIDRLSNEVLVGKIQITDNVVRYNMYKLNILTGEVVSLGKLNSQEWFEVGPISNYQHYLVGINTLAQAPTYLQEGTDMNTGMLDALAAAPVESKKPKKSKTTKATKDMTIEEKHERIREILAPVADFLGYTIARKPVKKA